MPVGSPYIGGEKPSIIGWLSHDTLCQEGTGRGKVTGCGKNAEICTFLGPVLRPIDSGMQRRGIGLSYTAPTHRKRGQATFFCLINHHAIRQSLDSGMKRVGIGLSYTVFGRPQGVED